MKYLIYQQGARGYGRISRSLKLARIINDSSTDNTGIIFSGDSSILNFKIPYGVDIVKIPSIKKGLNKEYLSFPLRINLKKTLQIRAGIIKSIVQDFQPDILFVDLIPSGVENELRDLIIWIKNSQSKTKIVLVSRDIIDSPKKTITEWKKYKIYNFLEIYYDKILVFGNKNVFDFCHEYKLSKTLARKVIQCNYIPSKYQLNDKIKFSKEIDVLITIGGGIDGFNLIKTFVSVYNEEKWRYNVTIILGGQFPKEKIEVIAKQINEKISILDFTNEIQDLYLKSKQIICMGGYNTLFELLALNIHPLVYSRKMPTKEQEIRTERLQALSLVTILDLNDRLDFKKKVLQFKNCSNATKILNFNLDKIIQKATSDLIKN